MHLGALAPESAHDLKPDPARARGDEHAQSFDLQVHDGSAGDAEVRMSLPDEREVPQA
jgi:hypothetical protein